MFFNAFPVGDRATSALLEDHVSGPRPLRVEPRHPVGEKYVYWLLSFF